MNEVVLLLQQVSRSSWRCRESSRWNDVERKGEKYKNQKQARMHQLWLAKAMNEVVGLPQGGRGSDDVRGCKMSCTAVADYFLLSPLSTLSICHNQTLLPAFALQHEVFLVVSIRTLNRKFTVHCFVLNPKGRQLAGSGDQKYGVCQLLHTTSTCSLSSKVL